MKYLCPIHMMSRPEMEGLDTDQRVPLLEAEITERWWHSPFFLFLLLVSYLLSPPCIHAAVLAALSSEANILRN